MSSLVPFEFPPMAEVAKREDETNSLTHKLAYISGGSGEEWADLDEGKSVIRNQCLDGASLR